MIQNSSFHTDSVQLCGVPNRCKDLAVHPHLLLAYIVYKLIPSLHLPVDAESLVQATITQLHSQTCIDYSDL